MQFTTFVSASALVALVTAQNNPYYTTSRTCDVVTVTKSPYECPYAPRDCTTLACITAVPVFLGCGCNTISTTSICPTACPTGCGATTYITGVKDCFPTSTPPYISSSTTKYTNSSTTTTTTTTTPAVTPPTTTITVTVCPKSTTCTGQTVTYTSTEVCPTSTCTCVLPGGPPPPPPVPVNHTSTTTAGPKPPKPTTTPIEANVAAGTWGSASFGVGAAVLGGFMIAVLGLL